MAALSFYSASKLNTFLLNKAFQQHSVDYKAQRWVSCIRPATRPVRTMSSLSDNVQSSVPRQTANYHSDVWNDDIMQYIQTPYHQDRAASYQQWADNLVVKIKEMFKGLEDGEISPSAYDTA